MSGIKKVISKITHARAGSKSIPSSNPTSPTGGATPETGSAIASTTEVDHTNGDGDTAAQRQQKQESQASRNARSRSRARSRDRKPTGGDVDFSRTMSPEGKKYAAQGARSQSRPGGRSRSRARRLSFTEERILRDEERAKDEEREAKARKERMTNAWKQDALRDNYGDLPMNMSTERVDRKLVKLYDITDLPEGESVAFRARIHHLRAVGPKIVFIILRQQLYTIQGVLTQSEGTVSETMVRWAEGLGREAIVLVEGKVQMPPPDQGEVKTTTVHQRELKIEKLHVIAHPTTSLPFQVEDISKPHKFYEEHEDARRVGDQTRLHNRVLDLRSPAAQSITKVHAAICRYFRQYLDEHNFTEIQSSKFQEATAESGAAVFKVDYFRKPVFLAQSPQLAKQMCIAADMERVYEIGPVFRAENSNTHRHLTEFIGLDLEMAFESHYEEVMDLIDGMFLHIFRNLQKNQRDEIETVKLAYPHDDLVFLEKTLRLNFADGVKLLVDSGWKEEDGSVPTELEDLSTAGERRLGQLVKEKYHTDYYILNKFPAGVRPFYTMRDPQNDKLSNSYDFFIRGEEILSGGQRIHDAPLLEERMKEAGIDPASMKDYLDGFKYGCPPHGGGGIGLERVVMLFLKLGNIRWASLLPRDPRSFTKPGLDPQEASAAVAAATILKGPESTTFTGKLRGELPPLENLIAHYGDATNTSWVDPAWKVWRDNNTGAAVGYIPQNGFAVTFGNPLCERKQIPQVINGYLKFLERESLKPVWACIDRHTEEYLADELGWSALIAVAEERINPAESDPASDKNVRRKIHRAERDGVKIHEISDWTDKLKADIEQRCKDWAEGRKGTQIHLTGVRPFDDMAHRKYFYATDKDQKICALVVLAQLSASKGFQIKWALEFPDAPLGAIEYILAHVIRKMGDAGVRNATFGAGATPEMQRVENIGGFRVRTLEKAYNGISHTFNLGNKGDFRSKFGSQQEPLFICYPKGQLGVKGVQAIMAMLQMDK